jgi:hypothetical protein
MFSFTDQEMADKVVALGQAAWHDGHRVFIAKVRPGPKNDQVEILNLVVNALVEMGWRLHSVAPYVNSIGPNNIEALITCQR